jgi:hypothetical protein
MVWVHCETAPPMDTPNYQFQINFATTVGG